MRCCLLVLAFVASCCSPHLKGAAAFYLPGSFPQEFIKNATIGVKVSSLTSAQTELPFRYYSVPFCEPPGGPRKMAENLGELLIGERVESSPYVFNVMMPAQRRQLCSVTLDEREARDLRNKVEDEYRVHMRLDGMPITNHPLREKKSSGVVVDARHDDDNRVGGDTGSASGGAGGGGGGVQTGFPLGFVATDPGGKKKRHYYLNNHLVFNVLVHKMDLSPEQIEAYEAFQQHRRTQHDPSTSTSASASAFASAFSAAAVGEEKEGGEEGAEAVINTGGGVNDHHRSSASTTVVTEPPPPPPLPPPPHGWMIVGFEVLPCSVTRDWLNLADATSAPSSACINAEPQKIEPGANVTFSFDVRWQESDTPWINRWDAYLAMTAGDDGAGNGDEIHWFSIVNSVFVTCFLAGLVFIIMLRTVRNDLSDDMSASEKHNLFPGRSPTTQSMLATKEDMAQLRSDAGWKLVRNDVFRPPPNRQLLCCVVGSGVQIFQMALVSVGIAALGFLSPESHGALLTAIVVVYMLLGFAAGYAAVDLLCRMPAPASDHAKQWYGVSVKVACGFPAFVALVLAIVNAALATARSSGVMPFSLFLSLFILWFLISVPLSVLGGYTAYLASSSSSSSSDGKSPSSSSGGGGGGGGGSSDDHPVGGRKEDYNGREEEEEESELYQDERRRGDEYVPLPLEKMVDGGGGGSASTATTATQEGLLRCNRIPRQIPPSTLPATWITLASGVFPFGTAFVEIYYIMSALWLHQTYYLFGFLLVIFLLTAVIVAEISIVVTYHFLCHEDYRWWWRSFFAGGSTALYLLIYAALYVTTGLLDISNGVGLVVYSGQGIKV